MAILTFFPLAMQAEVVSTHADPLQQDTTILFRFVPGNKVFYSPYKGNDEAIRLAAELIKQHRAEIDSGKAYLMIRGFCGSFNSKEANLAAAKERSNHVKSWFITHYGMKEENYRTRNSTYSYNGIKDIVAIIGLEYVDGYDRLAGRRAERARGGSLERRRAGKPFTFYHYMIDLTGGPCIYKRIAGGGAGTEYMAVTPWGDRYPCHQFGGDEKFRLGDVWTGVTNTEIQADFASCNVYAHPECRDCWARLYCSGGCAANAYHATGSVRGVYKEGCELFKKRMECAIMLEASKALDNNA